MKRLLVLVVVPAFVVPAAASAASGHRVDLATGRLDGHVILGRTVEGVTAALGRPDYRSGSRSRLVLGWGSRPNFSVEVLFRPSGAGERAWSLAFERRVRDVKLGDPLSRSSAALQREVSAAYRNAFTLTRAYACRRTSCVGEFAGRYRPLHLTFGTRPTLGTWLTIWRA